MRVMPLILALVLFALPAHAQAPHPMRAFVSVAISPDGNRVASIEGDAPPGGGSPGLYQLIIRDADGGNQRIIPMPCGQQKNCVPFDPIWEPDGRHIVFILRLPGDSFAHAVDRIDVTGGAPEQLVEFDGPVETLRLAPDGTLAMLVTPDATKDIGAVAPGAEVVGNLGAAPAEQRIAVLRDGKLQFASPPDLYVYEYAWRPDGSGFVGTAAPGDGDQNWWSAKLYAFDAATAAARLIYTPTSPQQQLTLPVVSPDGKQVAFIGGLMSDFDAVSGDAFVMPLDEPHAVARDITPGWTVSVISLGWGCRAGTLRAGLQAGSETQMVTLADTPAAAPLSIDHSSEEQLQGGDEFVSVACKADRIATIHQSYAAPEEIAVGPMAQWHDITNVNAGVMAPAAAKTLPIAWQHDGFKEQGWLLLPQQPAPPAGLPMITIVHGGPGAAHTPFFIGPGLIRDTLAAGYAAQSARQLRPGPRVHHGDRSRHGPRRPRRHPRRRRCGRARGTNRRSSPGHRRLELWRLHVHVRRHADRSFPRRLCGRRHFRLAILLRPNRHRRLADPVLRRLGLRRSTNLCGRFADRLHQAGACPDLPRCRPARHRMPAAANDRDVERAPHPRGVDQRRRLCGGGP
jgi:dipeptidyl aminopeptidase/acylaminoacyl peptidase